MNPLKGIEGLLVSAAQEEGVQTLSRFRSAVKDTLFSDSSNIQKKFLKNLKKAIEVRAKESQRIELYEILLNWDLIKTNIDTSEISQPIEGSDILFNKESVIEETVNFLVQVSEIDIKENNDLKIELTDAVQEAYIATFEYLQSKTKERAEIDEFAEMEFGLAAALQDIQDQFENLERKSPWAESFDLYNLDNYEDSEIKQILAESLDIDLSYPYIPRDEPEKVIDDNRLLIKGKPGSGKTRLLFNIISDKIESGGISEILIPKHQHITSEEINHLSSITFSGRVLLVWDDVHKFFYLNQNSNIFGKTVRYIENIVDDPNDQLSVIATIRTNGVDEINDYGKPGTIWNNFTEWTLPELQENEIWEFVERYLGHYNVLAKEPVKLQLAAKVIKSEPSPFFIQSSIVQAVEEGELTEEIVRTTPQDALKLWEEHYEAFIASDKSRKNLLWSIKILRELGISYYLPLVKGLYLDVFGRDKDEWYENLDYLEAEGWLKVIGSKRVEVKSIVTNDVQIDAISVGNEKWLVKAYEGEISDFLLNTVTEYVPKVTPWIEPILQQNFALVHLFLNQQHDPERIEMHFQSAINSSFQMAESYLNYASFLNTSQKNDKAEEYYAEAVDLQPESSIIRWAYADQLYRNEKVTESISQYDVVEELGLSTPDFYKSYGLALAEDGNFEEAKSKFTEAIKLGSTDELLYLGYAYTSSQLGEELDEQFIQRAEDLGIVSVELKLFQAAIALEQGDEERVNNLLDQAATLDPDNYLIYTTKGNICYLNDEEEKAKRYFKEAMEKDPYDLPPIGYGLLLSQSDELDELKEAAEYLGQAYEEGMLDPPSLEKYCEVLLILSNRTEEQQSAYREEAKKAYEELISLGRGNYITRFRYGQILYYSGNESEAEIQLWKAAKGAIKNEDLERIDYIFYFLLISSTSEKSEGDPEYWYEEGRSYIEDLNIGIAKRLKVRLEETFKNFRSDFY